MSLEFRVSPCPYAQSILPMVSLAPKDWTRRRYIMEQSAKHAEGLNRQETATPHRRLQVSRCAGNSSNMSLALGTGGRRALRALIRGGPLSCPRGLEFDRQTTDTQKTQSDQADRIKLNGVADTLCGSRAFT